MRANVKPCRWSVAHRAERQKTVSHLFRCRAAGSRPFLVACHRRSPTRVKLKAFPSVSFRQKVGKRNARKTKTKEQIRDRLSAPVAAKGATRPPKGKRRKGPVTLYSERNTSGFNSRFLGRQDATLKRGNFPVPQKTPSFPPPGSETGARVRAAAEKI